MSLTLFEVLQNAEHNLKGGFDFQIQTARSQLSNVIKQVEKTDNYDLLQRFDENIEEQP